MTDEQLVEAYVAEQAIEHTRHYLIDGRRFAGFSDEELTEHWVGAFRDFAAAGFDQLHWDEILDLKSEFALRRLRLPMHRVAAEHARYRECLQRRRRPDPAALERTCAELADLRRRLSRPKN